MSEEGQTLNTGESSASGQSDVKEAGVPSTPKESGDLVSTTSFELVSEPSEEKSKTEETPETQEETDKAKEEGKSEDKKVSEHVPYDRFEKVTSQKNEALERAVRAETELKSLRDGATKEEKNVIDRAPTSPKYKDMAGLTNDELSDWYDDDPKGFLSNLATQIKWETYSDIKQIVDGEFQKRDKTLRESDIKTKVSGTLDKFKSDNPDFTEMWDSGDIQAYMKENPGHNAMSAYRELTLEKKITQAREEAERETEKRMQKQFEAKQHARVLSAGASPKASTGDDAELADTDKFGGRTKVLAERLKRLRSGS